MSVKDFMTRKVVYISPDTTIAHAADLMREQDLHRLPVIENDKLVGLVTEGTIAEASPSKATSLSIYEMNYLLNKTKVKDVMIKDVITVSAYASLEDATYLMYKNKVGILPVVDNDQLYGVITDRDIFAAFLQVSGYGEEGVRARFIVENKAGELGKIIRLVSDKEYNIVSTVQIATKSGKVVIEVQIEGKVDLEEVRSLFEDAGIEVEIGLLEEESKNINKVFFKWISEDEYPYVHLKFASTLDGKIALSNGNSQWISNSATLELSQFYRKKYSSIMVGIKSTAAFITLWIVMVVHLNNWSGIRNSGGCTSRRSSP